MTQKEAWIEREARAARTRYWDGIGDWDGTGEEIRQNWRNVVAPFYQEPVADATTLKHLAEIARLENEVKVLREKYEGAVASHKALAEVCTEISDELLTVRQSHTKQSETRAVKIRFDVTVEDVWNTYLKSDESHEKPLVDWIMPFLAAHAVLEVPPGVPSVEELARVLYEAPDADADTWAWGKATSYEIETRRNEARAALAWFDGKRGEV